MFRAISALDWARPERGGLTMRAGVETGPAVVGPIGGGRAPITAPSARLLSPPSALQSAARPCSALVGPVTRSAVERVFEWSNTHLVGLPAGGPPILASYLERPRARPQGDVGRRGLAHSAPLIGRDPEITALREALEEVTAGQGRVILVVGDPGLGKTRLVHECRKLFMSWAGANSGRLPLWLEGRAASYASARPYGLYQQLLAAWVGVAPEESDEVARNALQRAMKAILTGSADDDQVELLAQIMGLETGESMEGAFSPRPRAFATGQLWRHEALRFPAYKARADGVGP